MSKFWYKKRTPREERDSRLQGALWRDYLGFHDRAMLMMERLIEDNREYLENKEEGCEYECEEKGSVEADQEDGLNCCR